MLLGLQLENVVDEIGARPGRSTLLAIGVAIAGLTIVVRMLFALLPVAPGLGLRERVVVGWCGMRGAISLAAALSIATDIPGRDEVVFLTFVVILVTLVGQGLTLPAVVRGAPPPERARMVARRRRSRAWRPRRRRSTGSTSSRRTHRIGEEPLRRLRDLYRARFQQCVAVLGGEKTPDALQEQRMRFSDVRRDLIQAERAAVLAPAQRGPRQPGRPAC